MAKGILIGPVPGLPAEDSVAFIRREILDPLPHREENFALVVEDVIENLTVGVIILRLKPHHEIEFLESIYLQLLAAVLKASLETGHEISCRKMGSDFGWGGDEGGVPDTPVVGPPKGPPMLFEHEKEPEREFLEPVDIAERGADWWKTAGD